MKPTVPKPVPGYRKEFKMGERVEGSRVWRFSDPVTQEASDINLKVEESDHQPHLWVFENGISKEEGRYGSGN